MWQQVGPFEIFTFYEEALRKLGILNPLQGSRVAQACLRIRDEGLEALPSSYRKNLFDVYCLDDEVIISLSVPHPTKAVVQDIFIGDAFLP